MYIFLKDSFLSIVRDRTNKKNLFLRARFDGDIECIFPSAKSTHTPLVDYAYRASVDASTVAMTISERIRKIDYDNFKDSVSAERGSVYFTVWQILRQAQAMRRL